MVLSESNIASSTRYLDTMTIFKHNISLCRHKRTVCGMPHACKAIECRMPFYQDKCPLCSNPSRSLKTHHRERKWWLNGRPTSTQVGL